MENNINMGNNQPQNIQDQKIEKNEKKGRGLFYFVIAFAVIIVAVVGATYAFFTANAESDGNSIYTGAAQVKLGISVDDTDANYNLIPVEDTIAKYAYAEQKTIDYTEECAQYKIGEFNSLTDECIKYKKKAGSTCIDDSGSEVCSTYKFTVTSTSSSEQKLKIFLGTTSNQFSNLWFAVYTDTGVDSDGNPIRTRISEPQAVSTEVGEEYEVAIIPRTSPDNSAEASYFEDLAYPTLTAEEPTKTFTIVLWIKETSSDQTLIDGVDELGNARTFSGYVKVTTGQGGVTGQIGEAGEWTEGGMITSQATSETSTPIRAESATTSEQE